MLNGGGYIFKMILPRLQYVIISTTLIMGILTVTNFSNQQIEKDKEINDYIERIQQTLDNTIDNKNKLQEELTLCRSANNWHHQMLSKGRRTPTPIISHSGLIITDFEIAFQNLGKPQMKNMGKIFCRIEKITGVNALILAGITVLESDWCSSFLTKEKNNLCGLGAYENNPEIAMQFNSWEECIMFLAKLIKEGGNLRQVGDWYATDPYWAIKVEKCMETILLNIKGDDEIE